jgi:hypothetical protein
MATVVAPLDGFPAPAPILPAGQPLEPVELLLERDHAFKKKKPDPDSGKRRIGCEVCGHGRHDRMHMGAPPSMNSGNHSMQPMAYQALKHAWQSAFAQLLGESGLPRGLEAVSVEGLVGFPTLAVRDGGNFRWMIEKALGDALVSGSLTVRGGWLEDDCFYPVSRYEFGGLQAVHAPGRSWLRLMLFPRAPQSAVRAASRL